MLAAIVKRELIDHLISLRFGLALVLTVGLMVLNALSFVGGSYEFRRDHYLEQVQAEQEIGRSNAQRGLWKLILHGGQTIYIKNPAPSCSAPRVPTTPCPSVSGHSVEKPGILQSQSKSTGPLYSSIRTS